MLQVNVSCRYVRRAPAASMTSLTTLPRSQPVTLYEDSPTAATRQHRNSTAPHNSLSLPFADALAPCIFFWTAARRRTVCVRRYLWICQATTMRRTRGIESSLRNCSARGVFHRNRLPPLSNKANMQISKTRLRLSRVTSRPERCATQKRNIDPSWGSRLQPSSFVHFR